MSDNPRKRARTDGDDPETWGVLRKVWNGPALAAKSSKQAETISGLRKRVKHLEFDLESHKVQSTKHLRDVEDSLSQVSARLITTESELETLKSAAKVMQNHRAELKRDVDVASKTVEKLEAKVESKVEELISLRTEFEDHKEASSRAALEYEKRIRVLEERCTSWKTLYNDLTRKWTDALAAKTVSEYNVTPEQLSKYKDFMAARQKALAAQADLESAAAAVSGPSSQILALDM